MLQQMEYKLFLPARYTKAARINAHLPHVMQVSTNFATCRRCFYVNEKTHHFCTNCGFPQHEDETQLLFQFREKQRKETLKKNEFTIQVAKTVLYILSAIFFASAVGILFSTLDESIWLSLISAACVGLFFLLARWSNKRPFTAMLTAFVIVVTFSTIAVFGELTSSFKTVQGIYTIIFCTTISWLLFRGIQAAYKTDLVNEEMLII